MRTHTTNSSDTTTRPGASSSLAARIAWAAVAGLGLAALLIATPIALIAAFGWPPELPDRTHLQYPHLFFDEIALGLLAVLGWACWAWLLLTVIRETARALRWGIRPATLRDTTSPARWLAGALIGTVATLVPGAAHAAPEPAPETAASLGLNQHETSPDHPERPTVWAGPATTGSPPTETPPAHTTSHGNTTAETATTGDGDTHTVRRGETLSVIAAQYYGDASLWPVVWEANRGRSFADGRTFTDPDQIQPDWELHLPPLETAADLESPTDATVHTVRRGETLSVIAEQRYGDAAMWPVIWEANRGRSFADGRTFIDPDQIQPDWDLLLPPLENTDTDTDPDGDAVPERPVEPDDDGEDAGDPAPPPPADPSPEETAESGQDTATESMPEAPTDDESIIDPGHAPTGEPDSTPPAQATTSSDQPAGHDQDASTGIPEVPIGIWLGAGTFLAAVTVAATAARLRVRRQSTRRNGTKAAAASPPLTGRLSDIERLIEEEDQRLAELPGEVDTAPDTATPLAIDLAGPIDLIDLAAPALGLIGPGQIGAARAAMIAAAQTGTPILLTARAAELLALETRTLPAELVTTVPNLAGNLSQREEDLTDADHGALIVCTGRDTDEAGSDQLTGYLDMAGARAIILAHWEPATFTLAANGDVEAADGHVADAGVFRFYTADQSVLETVLAAPDTPLEATETATESDGTSDGTTPGPQSADPTLAAAEQAEPDPEPEGDPAGEAPDTAVLRLCLFGTLGLYYRDEPVTLKQGARALTLLAVLATADQPQGRDELLFSVLADQPMNSAPGYLNSIISYIRSDLRELLGDETIDVIVYDKRARGYRLQPDLIVTDVADFDDAEATAATATDRAEQARAWHRAIDLYTGDLAPDCEALAELRDAYRAAVVRACRKLAEHRAEHGDPAGAEEYRRRANQMERTAPNESGGVDERPART